VVFHTSEKRKTDSEAAMKVDFKDYGEDWGEPGRRMVGFRVPLHDRFVHLYIPLADAAETLQQLLRAMGEACMSVGKVRCLKCGEQLDGPSGALCGCGGVLLPDCRAEGEKLRHKYAKAFDVSVSEVRMQGAQDEDALIDCPSRPALPTWSTGPLGTFRVQPITVVSKVRKKGGG
jgi:hypothetical protein